MGRAAGDSNHYTFALVGPDGKPRKETIEMVSVTTVIKAVLGGPPPEWGFKLAVEGVAGLLAQGVALYGLTPDEIKSLLKEADQTPWAVRNLGGIRGTRVHGFLEALAAGSPAQPEDGYERAVYEWFHEHVAEVVASELVVWSMRYGYCGTMDLLYYTPAGLLVQTDLKTHKPKTLKKPANDGDLLQLGGYEIAYEETHSEAIDHSTVLCVTEDGRALEDFRGGQREAFLSLLDLYRRLRGQSA